MRIHSAFLLYGACALVALPAAALGNSAGNPAHSAARVPQTQYRSAFQNYVPYQEQPLATWRDVNDEAGRVGGHVGVLRDPDQAATKVESSNQRTGAPISQSQQAEGQPLARGAPKAPPSHHMGR